MDLGLGVRLGSRGESVPGAGAGEEAGVGAGAGS